MFVVPNSIIDSDPSYNYELFFELSLDLFCIAGFEDGFFKRINPAVSKLLGYTKEELFSRPISDFIYIDDKSTTAQTRSELNTKSLLNFENRYLTKSGEIVWLSWTSMYVSSTKLVFAIAKNISHKKRLEEERNFLLSSLTKKNKELLQLTYTASHDLRAPVNNLLSVYDLMDLSKISDVETLELIGILKGETEKLNESLNKYIDLLNQKDIIDAQMEELDLNASLEVVLNSIRFLISHSKATIVSDFSELENINFNKTYLESLFLNLITNSIKYARTGIKPMINIYSKRVNGLNQLIVSDNGQGFDMKKVKDKIFGLNQTFNDETDSKGIGLYLIYNHMISLGGQISVESKINEGATFTMSFRD